MNIRALLQLLNATDLMTVDSVLLSEDDNFVDDDEGGVSESDPEALNPDVEDPDVEGSGVRVVDGGVGEVCLLDVVLLEPWSNCFAACTSGSIMGAASAARDFNGYIRSAI
jgi:hypothetical protein